MRFDMAHQTLVHFVPLFMGRYGPKRDFWSFYTQLHLAFMANIDNLTGWLPPVAAPMTHQQTGYFFDGFLCC